MKTFLSVFFMYVKIVCICFVLVLSFSNSAHSQILFLNNSITHVHSNNASGLSVDHEFGYIHTMNDYVSFGPSLEFFYFANNGNTTHVLLANANIIFSKQIGKLIPSLSFTASLSKVFPSDDGIAFAATAGTAFIITENVSFFLQGRYYKFSNDLDLGRFLTQFGFAYTF
jgi:hypothetical protein